MRTLHMLHALECPVNYFGVTVRRGLKWADLGPREAIALCVCPIYGKTCSSESIEGHAFVTDIWVGDFEDLPARLIENEHEIAARTYSGLLTSMKRAYGDEFGESETVTVITYERVD